MSDKVWVIKGDQERNVNERQGDAMVSRYGWEYGRLKPAKKVPESVEEEEKPKRKKRTKKK